MATPKSAITTIRKLVYSCLEYLKERIDDIEDHMDDTYVPKEGARGNLKGYEEIETVNTSSVAISNESADTTLALNATLISIQSGANTECFVKLIHTSDSLMAVSASSEYEWSGGVVPNLGKGVLIVSWGGTQGMLNFVSNVTVKNYTIVFVDKDNQSVTLHTVSDISPINREIEYTVNGSFNTADGNYYPIFDGMTRQAGTYTVGTMGVSDTTFTVLCEKV